MDKTEVTPVQSLSFIYVFTNQRQCEMLNLSSFLHKHYIITTFVPTTDKISKWKLPVFIALRCYKDI